ncbi:MAG: hypothetical protein WCX77_03040 [Candidatus Paceibacterota bacterium]|jgi:hypothetical protein
MEKQNPIDKKRFLRESNHLTRPPRMEGKAKNEGMNPIQKKKKSGGEGKK